MVWFTTRLRPLPALAGQTVASGGDVLKREYAMKSNALSDVPTPLLQRGGNAGSLPNGR